MARTRFHRYLCRAWANIRAYREMTELNPPLVLRHSWAQQGYGGPFAQMATGSRRSRTPEGWAQRPGATSEQRTAAMSMISRDLSTGVWND